MNEITINVEELLKQPDGSITDPETCRQIGLATTRVAYLSRTDARLLTKKVKYQHMGLYPEVQKPLSVFPEVKTGITLYEIKKMVNEGYKNGELSHIFDENPPRQGKTLPFIMDYPDLIRESSLRESSKETLNNLGKVMSELVKKRNENK